MKLLFDQNLPWSFTERFGDAFPGSRHVKQVGLATASDLQVWDFAKQHGFSIISKDSDFHQMSFLFGAPPKTIWLRCGNSSVSELSLLLSENIVIISAFLADAPEALLIVDRGRQVQ